MNERLGRTGQLWRQLVEDKGFILIRFVSYLERHHMKKRGKSKYHHKAYEKIGLQASMNAGVVCGPESGLIVLDVDDVEQFEKLGLDGTGNIHSKNRERIPLLLQDAFQEW